MTGEPVHAELNNVPSGGDAAPPFPNSRLTTPLSQQRAGSSPSLVARASPLTAVTRAFERGLTRQPVWLGQGLTI